MKPCGEPVGDDSGFIRLVTILGAIFTRGLLTISGAEGTMLDLAVRYLRIIQIRIAKELIPEIASVGVSAMLMQIISFVRQTVLSMFIKDIAIVEAGVNSFILLILPRLMGMQGLWISIPVTDSIVLFLAVSMILTEYRRISNSGVSHKQAMMH